MNGPEAFPHHPDADAFDVRASVRRIVDACLGHKFLIALTCVLTLSIVIAYMVFWPPVYRARVMLAAEQETDRSRDDFYGAWSVFRKDDVESEVQLMMSKPVLELVVNKLELSYDDVHHPFFHHAAYLWTESWLGKKYRTVKHLFFPPRTGPHDPTEEEIDFARTMDDFRSGVHIEPIPETTVGYLVVRAPSPQVADMANSIIDSYLEERTRRHVAEATAAYDALTAELEKAQKELAAIEEQREHYYDENSLLLEFEKDKVEISKWLELKSSIIEEEANLTNMEQNLAEVSKQMDGEDKEVVASRMFRMNELRENMKHHKFSLDTSLHSMRQQYRPDSREVSDLQERIEKVESMIADEPEKLEDATTWVLSDAYESLRQRRQSLASGLAGGRAALAQKKEAAAELQQRIESIPQKMTTARALGRNQTVIQKKYLLLLEKQMIAEFFVNTANVAPSSMHVVAYADPPGKPIWPNKKLLLGLGGFLGLGAGIGLAVLLDMLSGRVTRDRLRQGPRRMPIYATLDVGRTNGGSLGNGARHEQADGGRRHRAGPRASE